MPRLRERQCHDERQPEKGQLKNEERQPGEDPELEQEPLLQLGILRDASRRGVSKEGVFRYLITVEVQGQLHTYVHECGSRDRIDPGLRGQWVWLWVTPMSKITRYSVDGR